MKYLHPEHEPMYATGQGIAWGWQCCVRSSCCSLCNTKLLEAVSTEWLGHDTGHKVTKVTVSTWGTKLDLNTEDSKKVGTRVSLSSTLYDLTSQGSKSDRLCANPPDTTLSTKEGQGRQLEKGRWRNNLGDLSSRSTIEEGEDVASNTRDQRHYQGYVISNCHCLKVSAFP